MSLTAHAQFILDKQPKLSGEFSVSANALCQVATNTLTYMKQQPNDAFAVHAGNHVLPQANLSRVKETLAFVCQLKNKPLNAQFLKHHFDFYQWIPDKKTADLLANKSTNAVKKRLLTNIPKDQILLTKYYTKLLDASESATEVYDQALYALPYDEQGLTEEQAQEKRGELTRFAYTRQDIIAGVLREKKLAKPLVWLTEEALHDVLLQGTGVVDVDGQRRYFNVHRNNGISYDYTLGKREQSRYWYFAEVPSVLGYGTTIENKIVIDKNVAFAGNVKQLGLGKLFLIQVANDDTQQLQLGVLADQGGAFDDNLFQLDWLKGSYYGWQDYYQENKVYADYAHAWILLKKQE
ncbi:MltA domain-containing protein [Thalassotalea hakodatensis]|uniref:MltA domain-containing protein n=1 Tax=Thalassotalea hakodatensis TaxID=3030492 RepID=UPI0025736E22|nr:MltA domain-containing protein [Thalassotalea hakodatensis]